MRTLGALLSCSSCLRGPHATVLINGRLVIPLVLVLRGGFMRYERIWLLLLFTLFLVSGLRFGATQINVYFVTRGSIGLRWVLSIRIHTRLASGGKIILSVKVQFDFS